MQRPAIPDDEPRRLEALRELELLDGEPAERFDRLTRLAARLLDMPIAVVSLVDADREWFASRVGIHACEGPRETSFCGHAILRDDLFVVPDAAADERFRDNPQVVEDGIRFYAGCPLHAPDGERIGALCVKDRRPRTLDADGIALLQDLGGVVETELRLQRMTRLQRELRRMTDRAEAASRAKTEFLANMSHELRTPLNSIIGFSNILLKNKRGRLDDGELGYVERVRDNGTHLLELINGVLDISKIEAGQLQYRAEDIDVAAIVGDTLARLEGAAADKGLELLADVPAGLRALHTDPLRLRQILINLVGNAIKFTERGSVSVRVAADVDGSVVDRIDVVDTGIGIPADRLRRIFEPFAQSDSSTSRRHGGTGLGLTISDALCRVMGMRLEVESEPGRGSTFTIRTRPAASGAPSSSPPSARLDAAEPPNASGARGATVLIIDDDADSRFLMTELLTGHGCRVVEADGGPAGLRAARGPVRPDLIVLDLMMPGMNGWEVLRELRAEPRLATIPVAVCSIVGPDNAATLFEAVEILEKPVRREQVEQVLARHVHPAPRRVLVVDDTEDSRELLRVLLDEMGVEVVTATNGLDALETLRREPVDCVLLDLMMPVMDGFKFLDRLRADPRTMELPVLVVSAKELDAAERLRLDEQVVAILPKGAALGDSLSRMLGDWSRTIAAASER